MSRWRRGLAVSLLLCGCVEPQLGDAPFICNDGYPQCPDGYSCDRSADPRGVCVREGNVPVADQALSVDAGTSDWPVYPDSPWTPPPRPDAAQPTWDTGVVDHGAPPDAAVDGWPPHLGCQSHAECAVDPEAPCCCPMPLLPGFWTCLPLCFNPLCI